MAVIKCKECGAEVSTQAKACTKCGAPPPKRTSILTWVLGALFAASIATVIAESDKKPAAASLKSPEQKAAEERESTLRAFRVTNAAALMNTIKRAARNPDSVVFELVGTNEAGNVVCVEYRAQNGFGGMGREQLVAVNGKVSQDASTWNKNCTKTLKDVLPDVELLISRQ